MAGGSDERLALAAFAASVAEEAGALLVERLAQVRIVVDTKSTSTDMVTEVDRASEALIAQRILEHRPGDGLVGEEGTARPSSTGVEWVADPLDGTTNYLYGFPAFSVSIAAMVGGESVAAAVHDPVHHETFTAALGAGAWCNGRRLAVAGAPALATALVGTGFGYDATRRAEQAAVLPRVLPNVRDVRRMGSAALDLCWVALGRLDAYYERGLALWDWAGGSLVAAEAGATVLTLDDGTTVAAPPHLVDDLVALLVADGIG
ncbi:MAG TPA: inositol monophosphatase family protein [Acidimicrobiales bacterium]